MNNKSWGFIGTLLLGVVIIFLLGVGQILPIYLYASMVDPIVNFATLREYTNVMENDAFLLSISAIGSTLFVIPFIIFFVKIKGSSSKSYFSLNYVNGKKIFFWIFITFLLILLEDFTIYIMGLQNIPDFMLNITYPTELSKWLLVIAIAFFAPILEELIFRGFLLKGFSNSFLGIYGAIVLTSLIWAMIHTQYEWGYLVIIFITGLVLGYAKIKTNSLFIPILMHITFNLFASLELYFEKGIL